MSNFLAVGGLDVPGVISVSELPEITVLVNRDPVFTAII